ncbi:MAG: type II secretion system minor pseudopilin GspK [Nitrospinae bacterium]|nr:type II secretion system minor pseudopilin GspK [Nitrospinota bacterium]
MRRRPLARREGVALLLTVLIVSLLTITVFDQFHQSWIQSSLAAAYRDETKALFAARSGQEAARLILTEDATAAIPSDALNEEWAQTGIPLPIDGTFAFIAIADEAGKVNLNEMVTGRGYANDRQVELFSRLLDRLDLDPSLAGALLDWLDENAEPSPGGAEDGYYRSLTPPHASKNARLDSLDELALVRGFTPEVIAALRPHVTVWGGDKININTATPMALRALSDRITEAMVEAILTARAERPFASREQIRAIPGMEDIYGEIALLMDTRSDTFSVTTTATFDETGSSIFAVYRRSQSGAAPLFYKVL